MCLFQIACRASSHFFTICHASCRRSNRPFAKAMSESVRSSRLFRITYRTYSVLFALFRACRRHSNFPFTKHVVCFKILLNRQINVFNNIFVIVDSRNFIVFCYNFAAALAYIKICNATAFNACCYCARRCRNAAVACFAAYIKSVNFRRAFHRNSYACAVNNASVYSLGNFNFAAVYFNVGISRSAV